MDINKDWLSRPEAAHYLSMSPKTLANWAANGKGPSFRKVGGKHILYSRQELDAFVQTSGAPTN